MRIRSVRTATVRNVLLAGVAGGTALLTALLTTTAQADTSPANAPGGTKAAGRAATPAPGGGKVIGYFTDWGVNERNYHVKNMVTSGAAAKLTHINYAFGNVTDGKCAVGDPRADYQMPYDAASSVDGTADSSADGTLRGSFNQLRQLKKKYPKIKVIWSFGGWSWSGGFTQAAAHPAAFADSCRKLVEDPRWADVFDGIDIDWEYPGACGLVCDTSGRKAFTHLMAALRDRFGKRELITAAITADASAGGKIDAADYAGAAKFVDWYNPMTYDYFGAASKPTGPTAPHSPLTAYRGIPAKGANTAATISKLIGLGIPRQKLLLGIGFYGRGWTGVTRQAPGGTATGPAPGTWEKGSEDYKKLKEKCPATKTVGGTAYARCGDEWWSYDTPRTIAGKMAYAKSQGLGGSFFWELSGDTSNGELVTAVSQGLR
jgi:chitinase